MTLQNSRFLQAAHCQPVDKTPIWLMRQAGRYMKVYRDLRAKHSMLEVINTPELAFEVTMQPINAFDFDAAIIFADILPPLIGMGFDLEFVKNVGPRIHNRVERPYDIDILATPPASQIMGPTLEAIKLVVAELTPRNIPLIGFAGAPFTLASYAVEGGGSKTYTRTKALMYTEPAAWIRLMDKLVTIQADYLIEQAKAGASALQIFDSWAGLALGKHDYIRYVKPFNLKLIEMVKKRTDVPVINFSTGTFPYLDEVAACGGDVVGADWRMPLDAAWDKIGHDKAIMGNLDPVALLAPWRELKIRVDEVLEQVDGRSGHIFNLGHGIFPNTPVDNVRRLVDYVHEKTSR
ncbi:MAG: uroporphyrinogen decarboxylase [Chloroflexota bacterium]